MSRRRSTAKPRKASHLRVVGDTEERDDSIPCSVVVHFGLAPVVAIALLGAGALRLQAVPVGGCLDLALKFDWPRVLVDDRGVPGVQTLIAAMVESAALSSGLLKRNQAAVAVANGKEVLHG